MARDQLQPGTARPERAADPHREGQGRELHRVHGFASPQIARRHSLWSHHGAARLARPQRHSKYSAAGPIPSGATHTTMKITSSRKVYDCRLFTVTEDRAIDPKSDFEIKRSVVRHNGSAVMMAVDDKK